jgi:hypothetical protein
VSGENEQRFNLHFNTITSVKPDETEGAIQEVYSNNKTLHIVLKGQMKGDILVYNIEGKLAAACTSTTGKINISLSNTGIYIVKVITSEKTVTRKVWIN